MHHTAWISDRIPSSKSKQPAQTQGKDKQKAQEPPKSKEVRRLEHLRNGLRYATGRERDPKGGCFCQGTSAHSASLHPPSVISTPSVARMHTLSPYTPICRSCGLVLCELQLPHFACPHCASPLLTPEARRALGARLDIQINETLAQEEEERKRAVEQARAAAGAFPTLAASASGLSPSSTSDALAAHPTNQTHKVLSLNSKTKKVTVASYHSSPVVSRSASRESNRKDDAKPDTKRVAPPPSDVPFAKERRDPGRPWANLKGGTTTYIPPPKSSAGSSSGRPRKRGQGKDKGGDPEKENTTESL